MPAATANSPLTLVLYYDILFHGFIPHNLISAPVAELADAHGSGPCESNFIGVQVRDPFLRE